MGLITTIVIFFIVILIFNKITRGAFIPEPPEVTKPKEPTLEPVKPYQPKKWELKGKHADDYLGYEQYINSPLWQDSPARLATLKSDDYSCRMCHDNQRLEVHHITYKNLGFERPEELATLCHHCHLETHRVAGRGAKVYPPIKKRI